MKKVLFLFLMIPCIALGAAWEADEPQGSQSPSDLDTLISTNNDALVRALKDTWPKLQYSSSSAVSVTAGSVVVCNAGESDCELLNNDSSTSASTLDLDTGSSFTDSTTYYVYASGSSAADTFDVVISTNSSAPSGVTQYKRLGSFYVNGSGNISSVTDDETRVVVETGTISNGGTIPLPSGYSEAQCKWMVGIGNLTFNNWDCEMCGESYAKAYTTGRTVTACLGRDCSHFTGTVNYIIIGIK